MVVTLFGMEIFSKFKQSQNALFPINLTLLSSIVSGITTVFHYLYIFNLDIFIINDRIHEIICFITWSEDTT